MLNAKSRLTTGKLGKAATIAMLAALCSACVSGALPPSAASELAGTGIQQYKLGPGDKLRVITFGHQDLSSEFMVSDGGEIAFPLVGQIKAAGLTSDQMQAAIANALKSGGFVINPNVSAEVIQYRPFYILGEVQKPGSYPYSAGLTAMSAIATAGGLTYRANRRKIYVRRADSTKEVELSVTAATPVMPGDTIRIGERIF